MVNPMNAVTDNPWLAEEAAADAPADTAGGNRIKIEREQIKLEKRLCREVGRAITDFNMIEEGDKIMVCMSGGKDSYTMLDVLRKLQKRAPVKFELVAVNLDQKQPGFPDHVLPEYFKSIGVDYHIETQDTYSVVKRVVPEGKTTCGLCSRLRRAILYKVADELGCTKVALGHHRDDIVQTLMLNMFYGGRMKGMPPKLVSDDGKHVVIRPLCYVPEKDTVRWAQYQNFPIIPCNLCGSQDGLQRVAVGELLREWDKKFPGRVESMFRAMGHIVTTHMMDPELHDFKNAKATGIADPNGDMAFDHEEMPVSASLPGLQVVQLSS
ncbi:MULTISPECIES: tRNA 2-thiocytidine(32) synthetase TtcA [Delftia]|jgi:tRNA 2-thiocytidine biosynthesis protein TtcA|uniref:tRNA-cytidine(32) 2-sulfurtransferase n=2 Tax=Delftia TaxID=80865 RepID=A0AAX3SPM6_9BURK|nr:MULTISPECIES: tRNA 2-thiocytidine(32) synthetase TtcA [Delftia]KAA9176931.1 tRNA 2-thiocytidine(32) synthetase TtcA [Delftia sp. BR1]KEH12001.1 potassium ABC transporter ATPase [Delftia sp. 670]EPD41876.1 tRNA 2-thiocytidine biosynthesis protein TtcA [Delftia acidovorans CCUG 274B]EPD43954.1 tRNA 2-thiocytidine biosynthesis protein TtcA [Delftia acidovorans CCUG 15835]KEH10423.1 potassium ABC transporter ATPase [Delftia tsuruhatensis]